MLGIIEDQNPDQPSNKNILTIFGKPVDKEKAYIFLRSYKSLSIRIHDKNLLESIFEYTSSDILEGYEGVKFYLEWNLNLSQSFDDFYSNSFDISRKEGRLELEYDLACNYDGWANPWSMIDHLHEFYCYFCEEVDLHEEVDMFKINGKKYPEDFSLEYLQEDDWIDHYDWANVRISYVFDEDNSLFKNQVSKFFAILQKAHDKALDRLQSNADHRSLMQRFHFPDEVKVACEQYLLYFAEFLRDVGIEAKSSLQDSGNYTLFVVEPKNKDEALDNLRIALEVYLRLPNSPGFYGSNVLDVSIPVQRLSSQIQFLQSQLTLANATLQQKDFLISQQSQFIESQRFHIQQFSPQILLSSRKESEKEGSNEEPIVGDYLKVKDYEWGPLVFGLPELLRKMREYFSK